MRIEKNKEIISQLLEHSDFKSFFSFDISPYIEVHTFDSKETICREGDQLLYLYYLVSGKAKIYMSHKNGKTSLISFIEAPSIIGEMGLIGVEPYAKGIEAMTMCTCLAIQIKPNKPQLLQDAHFLLRLCTLMGEKTLLRTEKYAKSYGYPFENRLAAFILLTEQNGLYGEKHTEVSEYLNISYRHLLYVLNHFCKRNWLKKDGRKYLIVNQEQLLLLAKEIDLY